MKKIRVACAIIEIGDKVLVAQRSGRMKLPLKWEFPGGKIEENESEERCIEREIKEELNIDISLKERLLPSVFEYPDFCVELIPFIVRPLSHLIKLKEHKQYLLLEKNELLNLDWAEADIPILKEYLER